MIQFSGLASGLDTNAIIQALMDVERLTMDRLESRKASENQKLSLVGSLEGMVKSLQSKAESLSKDSGFFAHTVSLSQEGYFSVEASGLAQPGTHTITVDALAKAARFESDGLSDDEANMGTGTVSFDYGGSSYEVEITDAANSDIRDVADAINDEVGEFVTATVINTGTETNTNYEIILEAKSTGSENEIENLTVTGLQDQGTFAFTRLQDADDASLTLDGISITRSSNTFDDLLTGYSFTLEQADPGTQITLSSEIDTSGTIDNLEELVDEYNEIVDFINGQNSYSEDAGAGGALFGDSLLNRVSSAIYSGLFNVDLAEVQSDTLGYSALGLVGLDVESDGTLSIDRSQMEEKMLEDPAAFSNLLVGEVEYPAGSGEMVNGAFGKLEAAIEDLIEDKEDINGDPIDGLFAARKDAIDTRIDTYNTSIEAEEFRLDSYEQTLIARFSALEELMGGLQAQQAYLSQSL